jgi:hypothetical protein
MPERPPPNPFWPAFRPSRSVPGGWRIIRWRTRPGKNPQPFLDYFQSPNPQTCAVFIGERADLRTKFFQALEKKGIVVPFYPPLKRICPSGSIPRPNSLALFLTEDVTLLVKGLARICGNPGGARSSPWEGS